MDRPPDTPDTARRPGPRAARALFAALALTTLLLAGPFIMADGSVRWEALGPVLLAGTLAMTGVVFCHAAATSSLGRAGLLLALSVGVSLAAETAGVSWGGPFGHPYRYHHGLWPRVGGVPVFIPLAWFVLAQGPLLLLRRFPRRAGAGLGWRAAALKAVLCAACLAAVGMFLDPLATSLGAWRWSVRGAYFGTPLHNVLGWFLVALAIYGGLFAVEAARGVRRPTRGRPMEAAGVALTLALTALAHVLLVARLGSALPVLLTALTFGPFVGYWLATCRRGAGGARTSDAV